MKWRDLTAGSRLVVTDILIDRRDDNASFLETIRPTAEGSDEFDRIGAEIAAIDAAVEALEVAP